jgi:hypothetical protein
MLHKSQDVNSSPKWTDHWTFYKLPQLYEHDIDGIQIKPN